MTQPFHMIRLSPQVNALTVWAQARGLIPRSGDLGYALHAALAAAFGEAAPKPFRLLEKEGRWQALLGYSDAPEELLMERAAAAETPVRAALGLAARLQTNAMPRRWREGLRLRFDLRARPVVRSDGPAGRGTSRERDAFLQACDAAGDAPVERSQVYADWLADQVERQGGARLLRDPQGRPAVTLQGFQRLRIARRNADRKLREIEGPDALLSGRIEVTDGTVFDRMLRRGIGRHRAFGYGMLLLRPDRGPAPMGGL